MSELLRLTEVAVVMHGVLKLTWDDGHIGVVDLRGIASKGAIFDPLRDPRTFDQVKLEAHGHSIYWGEEGDELVDFGCDRLRELAEQQAALLAKAS